MIAEVYINRGAKKLNRSFDYNIPDELNGIVFVGSKVIVPFGKGESTAEAFVVKLKENTIYNDKLKDILRIEDNLNEIQMDLAKWMSNKYYTNVSECIKLMLTPGTRNKDKEKRIDSKTINSIYLNKSIQQIEFDIESNKIKSEKQIKVLKFIYDNEGVTIPEIELILDCSRAIVNTLIKNGYLEVVEKIVIRNPLLDKELKEIDKELIFTEEQEEAYKSIMSNISKEEYKKFLLFGVTGSGKTEIYLQVIKKVLEKGKTAILLVPEISLTPQMLERFISRFGKDELAILHSKLSLGERHDEWKRIKDKKAKIVIGARSAIFAPLEDIGVIIIDEEHDNSYKSETNPKYDTKEIATFLAQKYSCPIILGSATPDMVSFYDALEEHSQLLQLTRRANNSNLPTVQIIDLKEELANGNRSMLSRELYFAIENNIKNQQQTILFLNRRGYSTFIMCRECGYTVKCEKCNVSMTYHNFENKLKCHYCGLEKNIETKCPECNSDKIRYFGTGTQKLEEEILKQFPTASTIRMDIDTVTKKNSHEEILNKFKDENINILIGTQMVVKRTSFSKCNSCRSDSCRQFIKY